MHWERGWTKTYQIQNNIHSYTYQNLNLKSTSETWLNTSCGWFYPEANLRSGGWMRVASVSSYGGWIQVLVDSILRLTWVQTVGYELQLILSWGWFEFRWLDTSYSWLHPTTDSNSGAWIQLKADSILLVTMSCRWLQFQRLDTSYSWFHPAADSSSAGWTPLTADLYFDISSKFKDLFYKMHHFFWFVFYHLISATTDSGSGCFFKNFENAWRSLRKLEEASRL